uniref:Uncharacterized protein n=1 Tax=Medicago truncatula TaxID=3880 RepID=I3SJE1_MEDTR|nr:unknown [Medicago truncatula]
MNQHCINMIFQRGFLDGFDSKERVRVTRRSSK